MKTTKAYLGFVAEPQARRFCGPLFFTDSLKTSKGSVHANGSFGLVDTGKKKLLVTCYHVWEEFLLLRASKPEVQLGLCLDMGKPIAIQPEDYLVDADKRCDLATFDIEDLSIICSAGHLKFFDLNANRPPKLNVGDVLYFIGFPGKGRVEEDHAIGFPRQPFGVQATQVGESNFFSDCTNLKLQADDVAGISGCPCFVIREPKPMRLVGFTKGFSEEGNRLLFTYAHFIQPDGIIKYAA